MIMRPGRQLLLPASPFFIWSSLISALGFNMLLGMGLTGRAAWVPDLLAVVLVFWSVHQPQRIGMGWAFVFGVCLDVHQGAILGQHALAYTAMCFLAIAIHRRLLWFPLSSQAFHVLPLFAAAHAIDLVARLLAGGTSSGFWIVLAPLLEALLWPVVSAFLLMPQKRAPNPDAHRPL